MKIGRLVSLFVACNVISLVAISTSAISQPAPSLTLPVGWRLPYRSEVDQLWRSPNATHYLVVHGDFNGDGHQDAAFLMVRADRSGFAPFVALTRGDGGTTFVQVEKINDFQYLKTAGLKVAKPGTYRTACGKGYVACGPGNKESISIPFDAIEFFKREGPSRLIYWDVSKKMFAEAWLSD